MNYRLINGVFGILASGMVMLASTATDVSDREPIAADRDRSPVDLALSGDGRWLVTANQTSHSLSLIDTQTKHVVDEVRCGDHPLDLEFIPGSLRLLVTASWAGTVEEFVIDENRLRHVASIEVGREPAGIAIAAGAPKAYVGCVASAEVAEIDLDTHQVLRRFKVGNWPKYLTLSGDDRRLAIGSGGDGNIMVVDTDTGEELYQEPLANGNNLGQMRTSADGKYAYFTWMVYRTNPISVSNIQRGWVLASRIGRVRLDGPADREAISLDVPRLAVADPHDLVISADGNRLVASSAGTHELLVYRLPDLPFVGAGGPGDLIDRRLQNDRDRFDRIEVGGRPMGLRIRDDHRTVYVANFLLNAVQVVDLVSKKVTHQIDLGGPLEKTLARRGMEVFYDAEFSLDQWYSCHSCHQDGGSNARPMDTMNDGTEDTLKTVLPLYNVTQTAPWTWHGWQQDLDDAMETSVTSTMMGPLPSDEDKKALVAYLATLKLPPNPFVGAGGVLSETQLRGQQVFHSEAAACASCHHGPLYSDGENHDVGTASETDVYDGYNTPSLVGVYRRVRLLHNGSARSLQLLLSGRHSPELVSGTRPLTPQEVDDLAAFLQTL